MQNITILHLINCKSKCTVCDWGPCRFKYKAWTRWRLVRKYDPLSVCRSVGPATVATAAENCLGCWSYCCFCLLLWLLFPVPRTPDNVDRRSTAELQRRSFGQRWRKRTTIDDALVQLGEFSKAAAAIFQRPKKGRVFLNVFCWFYYFLRIHFCFHCSFDVFSSSLKIFCQTVMKS